jgi:hypothetical protein
MLRNLGEVLEIGFVVSIVTVGPTQYVIDFYTQRNNFLGRSLTDFHQTLLTLIICTHRYTLFTEYRSA